MRHNKSPRTATALPAAPEGALECIVIVTDKDLDAAKLFDRSTRWRGAREGWFPRPIQLSPSRKGWRLSAILAWLAEREANPVESRTYFRKSKKTSASCAEGGR